MALYDYDDEETRRQRRTAGDPEGVGVGMDAGWDQTAYPDWNPNTGLGTPESGYGQGGVDNPAYAGGATTPTAVKQETAVDYGAPLTNPLPGPPAPQPAGGGGQPSFQPAAAAPAPAPTMAKPSITDDVTRILQARLKDLSNPSDVASDPIYQQAFRAYQVDQLRGADRQRKQLAERTAATGGTTRSGGFNVGVRGIQERAGENTARYKSGLTLDRLQSRENQLNQAIAAARAVGQDDIANQLELQRLQLQTELGRGDLSLRSELGRGQLGLGYDNLGYNYADLVTRANRDAVLSALGGG